MRPEKVYLGDSVYCELIGDSLKLTTENGFGPSNEIWMDYSVLYAMLQYANAYCGVTISIEPKGGYDAANQSNDGDPGREEKLLRN